MHTKQVRNAGRNLQGAKKALIMLHGRGASAEDILELSSHLSIKDYALLAPQATNQSWYPYSFLVPPRQNEPWLSSALKLIDDVVADIREAGIESPDIFFTGFSQGACLALEYVTRRARRWGGLAAFTGGLIGDKIYTENYRGDFNGTPVFIGSGDPDPHVPTERVHETSRVLKGMNASVKKSIYPGMGHTILEDEIHQANTWVFRS